MVERRGDEAAERAHVTELFLHLNSDPTQGKLQGFPGGTVVGDTGDVVQPLGWEDPQGKEMTTHSSILAWRIPRTEEPGRLQSMGSQRVGHN